MLKYGGDFCSMTLITCNDFFVIHVIKNKNIFPYIKEITLTSYCMNVSQLLLLTFAITQIVEFQSFRSSVFGPPT